MILRSFVNRAPEFRSDKFMGVVFHKIVHSHHKKYVWCHIWFVKHISCLYIIAGFVQWRSCTGCDSFVLQTELLFTWIAPWKSWDWGGSLEWERTIMTLPVVSQLKFSHDFFTRIDFSCLSLFSMLQPCWIVYWMWTVGGRLCARCYTTIIQSVVMTIRYQPSIRSNRQAGSSVCCRCRNHRIK